MHILKYGICVKYAVEGIIFLVNYILHYRHKHYNQIKNKEV
jgi:hypothetical protein